MKKLKGIKNLIFDLGNVIYDIDYKRTFDLLNSRLPKEKENLPAAFMVSTPHFELEKGLISPAAFREAARTFFQAEWEDEFIDRVWNALLVDIPQERLDLLQNLKQDYRIYMLSNTNAIHFEVVEKVFREKLPEGLWPKLFDELFLSHEIGLRKPERAIYEEVLSRIGGKPQECLFFDDLRENLEGAQVVGIQTHLIDHPKGLMNFFADVQ
ncbi:HAD family hydrolase [Pleomorphovibrio marinus]|uniref:HAD family hydrolase n=1 Tax=Pleomorphovibrio marinus TaxID=2164132 RepID=UPI000E0C8C96|nr:HAD family phosphatase [Pleomorphovibrio marinus]